ncbi:MAG: transglycosylase SLT domain-containing protein [Gammaproteobacteria bacterium]|nr:transglycosylase SLT domain-containing protein [Gammaproteobacteria bacterium]
MNDNDDKTVLMPSGKALTSVRSIKLSYSLSDGASRTQHFSRAFVVGRSDTCDVSLHDDTVSREHVRIFPVKGQWQFEDLKSTNGTYRANQLVSSGVFGSYSNVLQLGVGGPRIQLELPETDEPTKRLRTESLEGIARRYFESDATQDVGEHTMLVRRAFKQIKRKYTQRYIAVISLALVVLISTVSVVLYQRNQLSGLLELTASVFYNMKELELQVTDIEIKIEKNIESLPEKSYQESRQMRVQIAEMEARYDTFLEQLGVYEAGMDADERLILKMARVFGESEVDMPADFVAEVRRYIGMWKSTGRLKKSVSRALDKGYPVIIKNIMLEYHLPPQFFYLALQESNFKIKTVGPPTRFGIAKGIWQFIPATARRYGLRTGPLLELPRYDPRDERFDFESATRAAARYLRDIYTTEAQASGLLVIASYNLGENRVKKLIRQLPENPRERNFWALLQQYKIPKQTYDYVFYIFSAAVIGENPSLFGFEFDNPLSFS